MKPPKLPFAKVAWNDAWSDEHPVTLADVAVSHMPLVIHTLGYILRDDNVGISIANEYYDEDETYRGRTFIPRSLILTVTYQRLSLPRKSRPKSNEPTNSATAAPHPPDSS